jgi:hypothetical protein
MQTLGFNVCMCATWPALRDSGHAASVVGSVVIVSLIVVKRRRIVTAGMGDRFVGLEPVTGVEKFLSSVCVRHNKINCLRNCLTRILTLRYPVVILHKLCRIKWSVMSDNLFIGVRK